jgi:hypothetical protein
MQDIDRSIEVFERGADRKIRNEGPASGPVGRKIVQQNVQALAEFIDRVRGERPTERTFAQRSLRPNIWDLIHPVPSDALALACLVGCMNYNATPLKRDREPSVARSMNIIGTEVEREVEGWKLRFEDPALAEQIERAAAFKPKRKDRWSVQKRFKKIPRWKRKDRIEAGAWAYDCCLQALPGVFTKGEHGPELVETAAFVVWPRRYVPSFRPPQPWTEFYNADGEPFLRHCRCEADAEVAAVHGTMQPHMDAVNYLKSIPWMINEPVLDFVQGRWLVEFKSRADRRVFGFDMDDAERVRGQTFYVDLNCDHRGRVNAIPHFHFGRGDQVRALFRFAHGAPITERGIWWLKVATANCYDEDGISRRPFEERVAWTEDNLDRIHKIAADPFSGVSFYGNPDAKDYRWLARAKHPHQFLAHAIELTKVLDAPVPSEFVSSLPISLDARCSGGQHYALLMRDRRLAELTNLIDSNEPQDLYSEVGRTLKAWFSTELDEIKGRFVPGKMQTLVPHEKDAPQLARILWAEAQELYDRKAQKGFIMPWIYGSGASRQSRKLGRDTRKNNPVYEFRPGDEVIDGEGNPARAIDVVARWLPKHEVPKKTISWFIKLERKAMRSLAPCIDEAQAFIKSLAILPLRWRSPSGVPILNEEHAPIRSTLKLWLGDDFSRNRAGIDYEPEIDVDETRLAAPPNVIHSFDASHLALVALACKRAGIPLVTVHDSYGTLPCHIDALRDILLRELRKMYEHDWLTGLGPNPPPRGDLRLEEVTGRYAFS